jgi:RNA polymerase sigma-70 factor (ECF subfamily)
LIKKVIQDCRKRQRKSQKKLYKMFYAYGMSITLRYADSKEQAAEVFNDAFYLHADVEVIAGSE